jgi:hypothetical protein
MTSLIESQSLSRLVPRAPCRCACRGYSEHRPKSCRKPSLWLQAMRGHDHSNRAFRPVAWPASRSIRWILRRCRLTGCARSRSNAISACTRSVLNVDHLPGDLTVSSFGPKMACIKCGTIGTDVRPNWRERQRRRQNCHRAGLSSAGPQVGIGGTGNEYVARCERVDSKCRRGRPLRSASRAGTKKPLNSTRN